MKQAAGGCASETAVARSRVGQLDQLARPWEIEGMRKAVNIYEAKAHLSELVDRAAQGEEIILAKAGKPRARLVPLAARAARRRPGLGRGKVWVAEDFDAQLPEGVLAAFRGG
jgi:prevent-host-death family protein